MKTRNRKGEAWGKGARVDAQFNNSNQNVPKTNLSKTKAILNLQVLAESTSEIISSSNQYLGIDIILNKTETKR